MSRSFARGLAAVLAVLSGVAPLPAQVRVTPKESKGGERPGELWADVPESFRGIQIPNWPVPTDFGRWQGGGHAATRATLFGLLGEMPPRPDPAKPDSRLRVELRRRQPTGPCLVHDLHIPAGADQERPG